MSELSLSEQWTLLRIAEAATPAGAHVPMPDGRVIEGVHRLMRQLGPTVTTGYRALVRALDVASVPLTGKRLSALSVEEREAALVRLNRGEGSYWLVRAVTAPLKIAQSTSEPLELALGVKAQLPMAAERHRYEERIVDARTLSADEELEVDVVVIGTGAGGAPVAKNLAARGHAVLMIEEGDYFTRKDFHGSALERQHRMYRDHGLTATLGNVVIPLPMGRTVGGTTTINSGTCYRTPESVQRRWQLELGLHELGPGSLDRYFDRVEAAIEVEPARAKELGAIANVIARGCDALGYAHGPLARNAPGCDAQATCCWGCPTDAKRSTNVSYVPQALALGAMLYCNARVSKVIVEGGRAVGVKARATGVNGSSKAITVRARAVVMACGAIHTPALLLRQGLANGSGQLGKNLTIHPAGYAWADVGESIRGYEAIPQGYAIEEFAELGIRFEGAFPPPVLAGMTLSHVGRRWTDLIERLDRLAIFGFMLAESSRGRVTINGEGAPRMTYWMNDADVRKNVQAQAILARIFFAAGASAVFPGMQIFDELTGIPDVERLEREGPGLLRAHHLDLSAYHPLGTCRMGTDPSRSVIGPSHEAHEVPGLFVCDGAAVPGPLGVNPQVTIMAMAERAAEHVERRVEAGSPIMAPKLEGAHIAFAETMSGLVSLEEGTVEVSFTVSARGEVSLASALRRRGESTWALEGTIAIDGIETKCAGTLAMRPRARRATLVYDLAFRDREGAACTLHGEKHTGWLSPLKGMTTLYTELRREGALLGSGVLTFDVRELSPWLRSFHLAR